MMLRIVCVAAAAGLALSMSAALVVLSPASATSSLTKEQAENIAARHIQMEEQSPDTRLSKIKEYFLFSVLAKRGTTSYCGDIRRPTWVIGISPDKTQGWRTGAAWNGGYPFLIDAMTGKILDCRS
jgi:hypothetical protein